MNPINQMVKHGKILPEETIPSFAIMEELKLIREKVRSNDGYSPCR